MRHLLERHTDLAVFLVLFLEDLGVPMPIPADVVIMYAGYRLRSHGLNPFLLIGLMLIAVNVGATALYTIVRRGGRPLVDRFGRFIHLDAEHLAKAEGWLNRRGMWGIMLGRALPGVRLATVISCGLFGIPYKVFAPAQFVGTAVYMLVFLLIGYFVGPQAAERIHLPDVSLRLVLLLIFVIGLPLLLRYINNRTASDDTRTIQARLTPGERIGAAFIGGFAGTFELTAIWAVAASLTNLLHTPDIRRAALMLGRWIQADRAANAVAIAYTLDYLLACVLAVLAALLFFEFGLAAFRLRPRGLFKQVLVLWGGISGLALMTIAISLIMHAIRRPGTVSLWLTHAGVVVLAILLVSLFGYAYVAVTTRRLAIDRFSDDPEVAPSAATPAVTQAPPRAPAPPDLNFGQKSS